MTGRVCSLRTGSDYLGHRKKRGRGLSSAAGQGAKPTWDSDDTVMGAQQALLQLSLRNGKNRALLSGFALYSGRNATGRGTGCRPGGSRETGQCQGEWLQGWVTRPTVMMLSTVLACRCTASQPPRHTWPQGPRPAWASLMILTMITGCTSARNQQGTLKNKIYYSQALRAT